MTSVTRKLQRPSRFLDDAREAVSHPIESVRQRPYVSAGTLLALVLAGYVAISIFPEVHRYIHVKRM